MSDYPSRKHPHHAVRDIPGKPTLVFVTFCVEDPRNPWMATDEIHALFRAIWLRVDAWRVADYTIMPDHGHFFAAPGDSNYSLKEWMTYWKREFRRIHSDRAHALKTDYWDTTIRNGAHYTERWWYLRNNPVEQSLVADPGDWPFQGVIYRFTWYEV